MIRSIYKFFKDKVIGVQYKWSIYILPVIVVFFRSQTLQAQAMQLSRSSSMPYRPKIIRLKLTGDLRSNNRAKTSRPYLSSVCFPLDLSENANSHLHCLGIKTFSRSTTKSSIIRNRRAIHRDRQARTYDNQWQPVSDTFA